MTDARLDFTKLEDSDFSFTLEKEANELAGRIQFLREKGICGLTPTAFSLWLYFRKISIKSLEQLAKVKKQIENIINSANKMTETERDKKRYYIINRFHKAVHTDALKLSDEELYELYIWEFILF